MSVIDKIAGWFGYIPKRHMPQFSIAFRESEYDDGPDRALHCR